jgi:arginyl-tRNA synthetase
MNLARTLKTAFARAMAGMTPGAPAYAELVRAAQNPKFGDYQANCAMPLGKELGRPPREVAAEILERLELGRMVARGEIAGPGFINLRLADDWLADELRRVEQDERLGVEPAAQPRTFVIDFSSPNVAKPMHVGHIRSTIIGDSLTRLLRFLGHRVVTDNHIGDWGTQFGMLIFGYKHLLDRQAFDARPVAELARLYRLVNTLAEGTEAAERLRLFPPGHADRTDAAARWERFEAQLERLRGEDPRVAALAGRFPVAAELSAWVAEQSRQETARLHAGDPENTALWQTFMPYCLAELERVYERLGVGFDHWRGESFYNPMLPGVVGELLERGIAEISEGAVCVFLSRDRAPCLVRKSDGAFLYTTTDLATVKYRAEQFRPDAILYVVDQRQSLHFQQFFEVARRWGYDRIEFVHVSFGTILGSDGRPFRTREGGTVGLEPLLDEAVERARKIVDGKSPELSETERARVAEAVGIGAIKYADLSVHRSSDYTFSWERMMALDGNSATYLQYAYVRPRSIFREGRVDPVALRRDPPPIRLRQPEERELGLRLLRFPETLEEAAAELRPNAIAGYLYELANAFSAFYHSCPVLKAGTPEERASRLVLCDLTARTLRQGLALLGIGTIDQM